MIADILSTGREHARTASELAAALDLDTRTVQKAIETERRNGEPICAESTEKSKGYYLAATREELAACCRRLEHRIKEITKTHEAMTRTLHSYGGTT